jgi:hypothetical protein
VFLEKGTLAGTMVIDRIYQFHWSLFIFLCGQENEPKEAERCGMTFFHTQDD